MFNLLYNLFITCLSPLVIPLFLFSDRGRSRLAERFGAWNLREKNVIWVHAASMGETIGVLPLIERIRNEFPKLNTLLTTTSVSGLKVAQGRVDHLRLLPFDSAVWLAHATSAIEIKALIISETELWPGLINFLNNRGVPIYIINGKLRDNAFSRYKLFIYFIARLLSIPKIILAADLESKDRYLSLGVNENRVIFAGNTKYDKPQIVLNELQNQQFKKLLFENDVPIITLGSIRPEEEQIWFPVIARISKEHKKLNFVVAPRHHEKFNYFADKLKDYSIEFERWSVQSVNSNSIIKCSVILLDTMGELNKFYAVSSLAFVGATLKDLGGHNPLEPAAYGIPICIGPYNKHIKEEVALLNKNDAVVTIKNQDDVYNLLLRVLSGDPLIKEIGSRAKKVSESSLGATQRVIDTIDFGKFV